MANENTKSLKSELIFEFFKYFKEQGVNPDKAAECAINAADLITVRSLEEQTAKDRKEMDEKLLILRYDELKVRYSIPSSQDVI